MANVRDVDDFIEQLSNCVGHITGDEVVFKKIPYSSEYVVRMRNHNEKVANIWYDYDKDKIIVQLIPAFRNMEYSLDDLTIENIKGIGQLVRKNALNRIGESMELEVAKKILNENGYILEDYNFYRNRYYQMNRKRLAQRELIKNELIEKIMAATVGYDEDELKTKDIRELKKILNNL